MLKKSCCLLIKLPKYQNGLINQKEFLKFGKKKTREKIQ